jgi:hypothetical protein
VDHAVPHQLTPRELASALDRLESWVAAGAAV